MTKSFLLALIIFAFSFSAFAQDNADVKKDQEAIKKVIQSAYVDGLQNEGNFDKIDKGFHPGFNLLGIGRVNEIWKLPIYTWKESTKKKLKEGTLPKKDKNKIVSVKFLNVDVTGTAAVAKIEFYVGKKLTYVDYLSLYKFEDGWKIVSKIFYKFPEKKD
ncbi:MAG: nuclear transport factor 2 family protein [Bacteroidota bacterium]